MVVLAEVVQFTSISGEGKEIDEELNRIILNNTVKLRGPLINKKY